MDPNNKKDAASEWAADEVARLTPPAGWQPDVERALGIVRQRARARGSHHQAWTWAGVSAVAASLALVAFPGLRAGSGLAWERLTQSAVSSESVVTSAALFDAANRLQYPVDYRSWVYVGTSLGLDYAEVAAGPQERPEFFKNVYIDPASYDHYRTTGEFREGTMLVLEVASSEEKNEPGLQGRYEKEILGIEASVKDSSRFASGWAYFSFTERSGERKEIAQAFPDESCWTCHDDHAETDHVFTQFYPVL